MIHTVGVDFGNSNCTLAIPKYDGPKVILNQLSNELTPSMVTYTKEKRYVGVFSLENQKKYPQSTIINLKQMINLQYDCQEREQLSQWLPYNYLVKLNDGTVGIQISYENNTFILRPEQCIACLFQELKTLVNAEELRKFVITVNPNFSESQIRSIMNSCKISQIECLCLLKSTTAAAISYMMQNCQKLPNQKQKSATISIIDIGDTGMTISIAEVKQQMVHMKPSVFTEKVNGLIVSELFEKYLSQKVKDKFNIDPTEKIVDRINFRRSVESAKRTLSIDNSCIFEFHSIDNVDATFSVSRKEFNDLFIEMRSCIESKVNEALQLAKVRKEDLLDTILIGGSSRVVSFQTELKRILGKKPKQPPNSDVYNAIGCAYMADYLTPKTRLPIVVKDISQHEVIARWGENCEATVFKKFVDLPAIETIKMPVINSLDVYLVNENNDSIAKVVIKTETDSEIKVSVSFQLTQSCTTNVKNCFYSDNGQIVKVNFVVNYNGDLNENEIEEFVRFENEFNKADQSEKVVNEAKNEFNSLLASTNELINNGFYDYIDPSFAGEVKEKITQIQTWAKEKENDLLSADEYKEQTCELKKLTSPVIQRMNWYKNSVREISALKKSAIELHDKFNDKVDQKIIFFLNKFIKKIEDAEQTMKYKDVSFNVEKNKAALGQLATNLENMSKKK